MVDRGRIGAKLAIEDAPGRRAGENSLPTSGGSPNFAQWHLQTCRPLRAQTEPATRLATEAEECQRAPCQRE
eukprot:2841408-Pyramimonas_sp.AAC.1